MINRASVLTACGVVLALFWGTAPGGAWSNSSQLTYLTFSRDVALPGVTLQAGTYAFDVVNVASSADIVRVRNRERTKVYYVGITQGIARPGGLRRPVQFGEVPAGVVPPIVAWYPADNATGHRFLYSK
jgi:hypothetical protein